MASEYRIEGGEYVFYLDGEERFRSKEVSVLYDRERNVMHRHGHPDLVAAEYRRMMAAFYNEGFYDYTEALVVVTGKFDIAELNKAIEACADIKRFYELISSIKKTGPSL